MTALGPNRLDDDMATIVAVLEARQDAIAQTMVDGIVEGIEPYAASPASLRQEVLAHCRGHLGAFLAAVRAGAPFAETDLSFVREATARRAHQGVPLDAVLHAFRIGHRVMWDAILAETARMPGGDQAAVGLARPSMEYIDLVSTAVADTFLTEQQAATADAARDHRDLLELVLAGRPLPTVPPRPGGPALDPGGDHVVVVAALDGHAGSGGSGLRRAAEELGRRAELGAGHPLVVVRHAEVVGLLPATDGTGLAACETVAAAQAALAEHGLALHAGVSVVCHGVVETPRGYAEARDALAHAVPSAPLFALPRISPYDYLVVTADATAARTISPGVLALARSGSATHAGLVQTVLAFASCDCNVRRTADALHAHPNTVHYRLRRVAELTGRDPHRVEQLIELVTSLRLVASRTDLPG